MKRSGTRALPLLLVNKKLILSKAKRSAPALPLLLVNKKLILSKAKRSQVWIETVVYTLIAFAILGAILGFAKPKIEQLQDKSIIEQSIKMLGDIDATIEEIQTASGNKREIELTIRKGSLNIDAQNDKIIFEIESKYTYSEPEALIQKGNIKILNNKIGKINKVNATISYAGKYNLTLNDEDKSELLAKSSASYKLFISNKGKENNLIKINFEFA